MPDDDVSHVDWFTFQVGVVPRVKVNRYFEAELCVRLCVPHVMLGGR
jgi:hypothetical protein